jgi:hypothetical protein
VHALPSPVLPSSSPIPSLHLLLYSLLSSLPFPQTILFPHSSPILSTFPLYHLLSFPLFCWIKSTNRPGFLFRFEDDVNLILASQFFVHIIFQRNEILERSSSSPCTVPYTSVKYRTVLPFVSQSWSNSVFSFSCSCQRSHRADLTCG